MGGEGVRGELAGRVVIVTGGGNGIGRAMCEEIACRGGNVVVADIDPGAASAVASGITAGGGEAIAQTADVADAASVDRMVEAATRRYGRVDGLVNNAAIYATVAVTRAPYDEITEREWDDMMRVNVKGTWLCSRAAARVMRAQGGGGSIVNVSSGTAFKGTQGLIHYVTSKAGILGFTRSLARELGPHQIRVNCIAPGATDSRADHEGDDGEGWSPDRALTRKEVPADIVGSVVFLLSDMSAFVTGQTLVVDGGSHLHLGVRQPGQKAPRDQQRPTASWRCSVQSTRYPASWRRPTPTPPLAAALRINAEHSRRITAPMFRANVQGRVRGRRGDGRVTPIRSGKGFSGF